MGGQLWMPRHAHVARFPNWGPWAQRLPERPAFCGVGIGFSNIWCVSLFAQDVRALKMDVLLIDDETEICLLLKRMLHREGFRCDMAHTMAQGRERLAAGHYKAVFLDIHLPDGLGYQMIPEIRGKQPDAQVIAISAMDSERQHAENSGADLFIAKPFDKCSILGGLRTLGLTD